MPRGGGVLVGGISMGGEGGLTEGWQVHCFIKIGPMRVEEGS